MIRQVIESQSKFVKFWLPALFAGFVVWVALLWMGDTPIIRASGLALVTIGVTLALRRMGSVLAVLAAFSLAFSPVFWSQTGGAEGEPATIVLAIVAAILGVILVIVVSKRPEIGLGIGIIIFAVVFWSQIGTPRSIRLTGFVISWLMFLLVDMLIVSNPRPEDAPLLLLDKRNARPDGSSPAQLYHILGILLLITVGVINDPLLILIVPSIILSFYLSKTRLSPWYWVALGITVIIGVRGFAVDYLQNQAHLLVLDEWRHAERWISLIDVIVKQYSPVGILLSALGLARLARWYPPLGAMSLTAFAAYWLFGLVYTGANRDLLLLPLFVIQLLWMTYAVLALSEWVTRSLPNPTVWARIVAGVGYSLLPIWMILQIIINR